MQSASQLLGCIWGMSSALYPLFHYGVTALGSTETMLQGCLNSSKEITVPPRRAQIYCPLLFGNRFQKPARWSTSSLVQWCSLFVPPRSEWNMSYADWQRWLACVEGSRFFTRFQSSCSHDVLVNRSMVASRSSLWDEVEAYCKSINGLYSSLWSHKSESHMWTSLLASVVE